MEEWGKKALNLKACILNHPKQKQYVALAMLISNCFL